MSKPKKIKKVWYIAVYTYPELGEVTIHKIFDKPDRCWDIKLGAEPRWDGGRNCQMHYMDVEVTEYEDGTVEAK